MICITEINNKKDKIYCVVTPLLSYVFIWNSRAHSSNVYKYVHATKIYFKLTAEINVMK